MGKQQVEAWNQVGVSNFLMYFSVAYEHRHGQLIVFQRTCFANAKFICVILPEGALLWFNVAMYVRNPEIWSSVLSFGPLKYPGDEPKNIVFAIHKKKQFKRNAHTLAQNNHCKFWRGMHLTCKNTPIIPDRKGSVKRPEKNRKGAIAIARARCKELEADPSLSTTVSQIDPTLTGCENRAKRENWKPIVWKQHGGSWVGRIPSQQVDVKWNEIEAGTSLWRPRMISHFSTGVFAGLVLLRSLRPPASYFEKKPTNNLLNQQWNT